MTRRHGLATFIQIDDETLADGVPKRIDAHNWRVCDLDYKEISMAKNQRPL